MIADYHIHTHLCPHAEGEPREYVERAIELGMPEMGFSDHLPFVGGWEPRHDLKDDWAMGVLAPGQSPDRTFLTLDWRFFGQWSLAATMGDQGTSMFDLLWRHRY